MHDHIFNNYTAKDRGNLIGLLQDVQEIYGYLPEIAMQDIADFLDMPLSGIYGVATFYNQFRLTPLGKNIIRVCRGTACHVKGSNDVLTALEIELGVNAGETTRDKLFTLETVACIGACSIAPVININEEYYGRLAVKEIPKIINKYKREAKALEKSTQESENKSASVK